MTKKKILFLIGNFGVGGKERQLAELIKSLPKCKYEIHLIVKNSNAFYLSSVELASIIYIDLKCNSFKVSHFFFLKNYISKHSVDIVHSWATPTSFMVSLIKIFGNKKFNLIDGSIRQTLSKSQSNLFDFYALQRLLIKLSANLIIANSNAGLKSYNIKQGHVIYNGYNLERNNTLTPVSQIKSSLCIKDKYIVTMVARFEQMKDYGTYFASAKRILALRKDVVFLAIGGGTLFTKYSKIYSQLDDCILLLGERADVESIVNASDICVLCSYGEGISNSVMEYMSFSKPVIATIGGGMTELIIDNENGFLIQQGDVESLFIKLNQLLDDKELREALGIKAKEHIEKNFSIKSMVSSYMAIYDNV